MRIRHLGIERNRAEAVTIQKRKKPIMLAESRADALDMWFGIRAIEGKMQCSMM